MKRHCTSHLWAATWLWYNYSRVKIHPILVRTHLDCTIAHTCFTQAESLAASQALSTQKSSDIKCICFITFEKMNNVYGSGTKEHWWWYFSSSKKIHSLLAISWRQRLAKATNFFVFLRKNGNSTTNELYADILTFWKWFSDTSWGIFPK